MKQSKKGGARAGAGRPAGKEKINTSITLSPEVVEALNEYSDENRLSKSWIIETALRQFLTLKS